MCADFSIRAHGAIGNSQTNNSAAIQSAIDARAAVGGGCVVVPTGYVFLCGTISLKSRVELAARNGAAIEASVSEYMRK